MNLRPTSGVALLAVAAALPLAACGLLRAQSQTQPQPGGPSPQELQALLNRVVANQHHNDNQLQLFEWNERQIVQQHANDKPSEDKTWRVIPTGTGTVRVLLQDAGIPVDPAMYRKQLQDAEQALVNSTNPNLAREKQDEAKFARRKHDRDELVDAIRNAFVYKFQGREVRDGRTLAKFSAEPNPDYHPTSRMTAMLLHVRGTAWVDESAGQVVRLDAEIFKDISFFGGIAGKIYHGSRIVLEQGQVAPGIYMPTRYEFDAAGRKFLFSLEIHKKTEESRYRRIGPPREALGTIRRELSSGGPPAGARSDP